MDQVIILLRNPRWAIPSYHNMRWELDYAKDWASSFARIPDTYTERPAVEQWEQWRDRRAKVEADRWYNFIDFWMTGGYMEATNRTHNRCLYSEIDCHPRAVIEFDRFYQENPTEEFYKITDVLEASNNVEIVAAQARVCVLDGVYGRTDLHQGGRPHPDRPPQFRFTVPQFDSILNRTVELINKYSEETDYYEEIEPNATQIDHRDVVRKDLVKILDDYYNDNYAEFLQEVIIFLEEYVESRFGTTDCASVADPLDSTICSFMKDKDNHDIFIDGFYPDDFPYYNWLDVSILLNQVIH